ncbi:MAG: hypothetical protein PHI32_11555 [Dysgonamonadaceae bacterium]|nr:hypothetical protein [Dysgonamonadaceae bacterium]
MKKALIISLKFNPGHVSHLVASYKQCEDLGYESYYFVNERFSDFLPREGRVMTEGKNKIDNPDLAIFTFPSLSNLKYMIKFKTGRTRIVYIFHEPVVSFNEYLLAGYSNFATFLERLKDLAGCFMVRLADAVILPSKKAYNNFNSSKRYKNKNNFYIPLLFDDESLGLNKQERKFFSYIGTIATDHSFNEYLNFVLHAIEYNLLPNVDFLIVTKSTLERNERINAALSSGRLLVKDGKPMTNEEININYAKSILIWNAYERMMQSGVLPKGFMFGTPALVLRKNESEFVKDGEGVFAIDNNNNFKEIENGVISVMSRFGSYSDTCKLLFNKHFYYKTHNASFEKIINKIT